MKKELMTVTAYCNHADLSRTTFYEHKRTGALDGCFVKEPGKVKPLVDVQAADEALKKNVRYDPGGQATKRKFAKMKAVAEPPDVFEVWDAGFYMHFYLTSEFGLRWIDDPEPIPREEMEERTTEALNTTFSYLADIATGAAEDPAESAIMAVLSALIGCTGLKIDYEKMDKRPRLFAEVAKCKKKGTAK